MNTNTGQNPNTTDISPGGRAGVEKEPGVSGTRAGAGTGATAGAGGVGTKIKGAYHVIHGMSDNVRGTALGAIDTATHKGEGTENDEIARRGRVEMEQGLAAFRQPKTNTSVGNASIGQGLSTGVGPGTGSTTAGAAFTQNNSGQDPESQTTGALSTTQPDRRDNTGYGAPPTHPGVASATTAAHGGTGIAAPGVLGATGSAGGRNGGYGPQNPTTGAIGQYPPGPRGHVGGNGNHDQTSGIGAAPQDGSRGYGGYGQPEKHTTEQFASRATSVPNHGASQMNNTNYQGQSTMGGSTDAKDAGILAHHHRDDAATNLNAHPEEKHGEGQLSTARDGAIPDYDRNEGFETRRGGGDVQGGDLRQVGLSQGHDHEGKRGDMPGTYGGGEDSKGQYER